jgi:hypothetical protein
VPDPCQILSMTESSNAHSAVYAVVHLREGRYAVEITKHGEAPISVKPFWTEGEANEWVAVERRRAAKEDT